MLANASASNPKMQLAIGPEQLCVRTSAGTQAPVVQTIDIGVESIARACFKHEPPSALELERAIEVVEDALEALRGLIAPNLHLHTDDKGILEIATLASVPPPAGVVLSREVVEQTFERLAAVAQGRPASLEGLPQSGQFAARLLILREFMHHMKFDAITLET